MSDNITDIKIRQGTFDLTRSSSVTLSRQGEQHAEVSYIARRPKQTVTKLSADEYMVNDTGEIKQYQKNDEKQASNIRVTLRHLRALIRTNFTGNPNRQLHITLTYPFMMTDGERLYKDFKKFMMRVKYAYPQHKFEYIAIAEPQATGSWHMHLLLRSDTADLYIPKAKLPKLWGYADNGTRVDQLPSKNDIGRYFETYFTDITTESDGVTTEQMSKARQKGARLKYYPVGFKFYRTSRGIARPIDEQTDYGRVLDEYGAPKHTEAWDVVKTGGASGDETINRICKTYHKK